MIDKVVISLVGRLYSIDGKFGVRKSVRGEVIAGIHFTIL